MIYDVLWYKYLGRLSHSRHGEFDIILGISWLFSYNAIIDYYAKTVTRAMPERQNLSGRLL